MLGKSEPAVRPNRDLPKTSIRCFGQLVPITLGFSYSYFARRAVLVLVIDGFSDRVRVRNLSGTVVMKKDGWTLYSVTINVVRVDRVDIDEVVPCPVPFATACDK